MTHHPRRTLTPGPRRLELQARLVTRNANLRGERLQATIEGRAPGELNGTIAAARSATRQTRLDNAARKRGGPGRAEPLTYREREQRYLDQNLARGHETKAGYPLTVAQKRQLRRLDEPEWWRTGDAPPRGWTFPKGRPTAPRMPR